VNLVTGQAVLYAEYEWLIGVTDSVSLGRFSRLRFAVCAYPFSLAPPPLSVRRVDV
jgi:hypothetical protein